MTMYSHGAVVRHRVTGGVYVILGTPSDGFVIEDTNEPAYLYKGSKEVWVRPQSEMEDGRFVLEASVLHPDTVKYGRCLVKLGYALQNQFTTLSDMIVLSREAKFDFSASITQQESEKAA